MIVVDFQGKSKTEFLNKIETGVKMDQDGGIICDPFLESSVKDIFVAGDASSYPNWINGEMTKAQNWHSAISQGDIAAKNMLGKYVAYSKTAF